MTTDPHTPNPHTPAAGWPNVETRLAALWARNDANAYAWWIDAGRAHRGDLEALAAHLAEHMPSNVANNDLDPAAYLAVAWDALAEACAEDVRNEDGEA